MSVIDPLGPITGAVSPSTVSPEHVPLPPPAPGEPSPAAPPPSSRGRRSWPWIAAVCIVGVLAVALFAFAALRAAMGPSTLIDDDLDDGDGPFVVESDPDVSLRYEDGGYVVDLAPSGGDWQVARSFWDRTEREVHVAVSYEIRDTGSALVSPGVLCAWRGGQYTFFATYGNGVALVLESTTGDGSVEVLADRGDVPVPVAGRLELSCLGGGNGPTTLIGSLDGVEVLRHEDPDGFDAFLAMGVAVFGQGGPEVLFDDPLAERV